MIGREKMEPREAVRKAIKGVEEFFADENITNLGLEEVEYDDATNEWQITVGSSRPWDYDKSVMASISRPGPDRSYKVVRLDGPTGTIRSIKNREV